MEYGQYYRVRVYLIDIFCEKKIYSIFLPEFYLYIFYGCVGNVVNGPMAKKKWFINLGLENRLNQ